MIRRILISLTAVAFAIMATGCLVVTGSSYHESGVKVTPTTLDRLELGTTTEAWVIFAHAIAAEEPGRAVISSAGVEIHLQ